jgi:hypothetical protein
VRVTFWPAVIEVCEAVNVTVGVDPPPPLFPPLDPDPQPVRAKTTKNKTNETTRKTLFDTVTPQDSIRLPETVGFSNSLPEL